MLARAKERLMPIGHRAFGWVRAKIVAQPSLFGRAPIAAAELPAVGIERHHVPATELVAVVAEAALARELENLIKLGK